MDNQVLEVVVKIPFQNDRFARIAYDVLRVDEEPKRSVVKKQLSVNSNVLIGQFTAESASQIRVAVNCFFDNVVLVIETFEFTGPPVSAKYSHF